MSELGFLIASGLILLFIVCGVIIFFFHRALVASTEGAVNRLNEEIAKTNQKQGELTEKLRKADEELTRRQQEAKELANKMRTDAEHETKAERDKIIQKARLEGEDIIAKAQHATEKMRKELEKEMDIKGVKFSMQILSEVMSEQAKGALNQILINDFIARLKNIDMSMISSDVKAVDIITLTPLDNNVKAQISKIINENLKRDLVVDSKTDTKIGGGVILKFGSMALDGSLSNAIREKGIAFQEAIERQTIT
ncbi:MAG: F0F1 ATP synthase subunit delta [Candidatus Omnitrophica bacterium]|nr:F0F1 ATP synthase subunit delta [Candidatus Omnitrophota bacterium]